MLTKVGTAATNGQGGFASVNSSAPYDLTDCDTFSVMIYGGPWAGTIQFEGSLDKSNWFPITMHSINGTIAPSTTTNVNGVFFKPSSPALLYCRINMTVYTSGALSFLIVGHRMGHVDYTDFWSTAMPFTRDAVFAIDASRSSVGETVVVNAGTGGTALNATLGSTGSADSNDPLLLPWTGENYLYCPGVAGNSASAPDSAALDITGDIEFVCRVALDDWSPATGQTFMAKRGPGVSSYLFRIPGGGLPEIAWWTGAVASVKTATSGFGAVDGVTYWLKATLDVDNGAAGYDVKFYYAADQASEPTVWTQFGATVTTVGVTSIDATTATMFVGIGDNNISEPASGKFYRAIVRNGIGGTTVFAANFTTGITSGAQATFTESSSNAATVTINRAAAGRKSVAVTRPVWLFGTDDYMEVADNALLNMDASQSFTVLAVVRQWATPTSYGRYIDKKNGGGIGVGYSLSNELTNFTSASFLGDGVTQVGRPGTALVAGAASVVIGVTDRTAQTQTTYANTTASATTSTAALGALTNALPMRIGVSAASLSSYQDFELLAIAVFRRALSATEIAAINTYYGTA